MKRTLLLLGILLSMYLGWNLYKSQSEIWKQVEKSPTTPLEMLNTKTPYSENSPHNSKTKELKTKNGDKDDFKPFYEMTPDFLTGVWRADYKDIEIILEVYVEDGFFSGNYCASNTVLGLKDCKNDPEDACGMMGEFNDVIIEIDYSSCMSSYNGKGLIKRKGENMIWTGVSKDGILGKDHLFPLELTFLKLYDDPFQE